MLDPADYKEPACALCGGAEFYNPSPDAPIGRIPVDRIIDRLDGFLNKNAMDDAEKHLSYWLGEATALKDKRGELSILSEMMGLYRKTGDKTKGLEAVDRGISLVSELGLSDSVSGATVLLNAATTKKAFGQSKDALPLYARVEKIYDNYLKNTDPRKAGLYNNRALAYVDLNRFSDAENDYIKAIETLVSDDSGENEIAITYVNLAHLYEAAGEKEKIKDSLINAKKYINSPKIIRNGYHAYVCSKCAPSFGYFGDAEFCAELEKRAKELYERS